MPGVVAILIKRAGYFELQSKIAEMLIDKGFDKFTINMALSAWPVKDSKKE
jgi:hypothetical protein